MKIAFVAPFFGADASGGAEFAARSLAIQLAASGIQTEVLTTCLKDLPTGLDRNVHPEGLSKDGQLGIRRFPVPSANMEHFALLNHSILANIPLTHAEELHFMTRHVTSPKLLDWIDTHHNDYDWFCFIPYLFGTTCFGVPIAGAKSIAIPCFHDEGYARLKLVQRMADHTNTFVFNCSAEQRFAQKMYGLVDNRCKTVGLGMDTDVDGSAERFAQKTGIHEPFILYVGRRDTTKNVHTLIQYFQAYKAQNPSNLKLALIGPAPLPMTAPDPDILDLGFVSEQEKYDAYHAAAVFCQPSVNESFSYVMMEAWLSHTPCLVHADCAVTHDHVIASNGGLAFRSQAEFSAMLQRLLSDKTASAQLAEQGRQYVLENYAWDRIIQTFKQDIFT